MVEEYEAEVGKYVGQLNTLEGNNIKTETTLKTQIKKLEAECSGLENQVKIISKQLSEKCAKINDLNQETFKARKDLEICQNRMGDATRECNIKISEIEIKLSKETIIFKREIEHLTMEIDGIYNFLNFLRDFFHGSTYSRVQSNN